MLLCGDNEKVDDRNNTDDRTVKEDKSNENNKETNVDVLDENSLEARKLKTEIQFKFSRDIENMKLKYTIINSYKKYRLTCTVPKLVEHMKKDLDSNLTKGWIVFAGKCIAGACSYIENTMIDFEVEGLSFVVFQVYVPENAN